MPWNKNDYPVSMKNLKPRIRHKAIDIANALLDEGYDEGRAIAIATAKAEEWDENHPDHKASGSDSSSRTSSKKPDKSSSSDSFSRNRRHSEPVSSSKSHHNIHVVPTESGWAIKQEGTPDYHSTYDTKAEAVDAAKAWSTEHHIRAIIHNQDGQIARSLKS
ncbi:DUF2188 domain-containing protein [Paenibacillus polysaccharolyticus]|uniref:DUF2188 domain-containing protein n=1 Tax=Paenibacillus polysaccharolyticus TaxID=582692 RepID=UPI00203A9175|nr:DUF2188 domain-containing protein [Paenibacillus polysaccharolyticus]MCM3136101.1 DUF2188 domain-containing protein [Paenibacillus polysaccharolyticus]